MEKQRNENKKIVGEKKSWPTAKKLQFVIVIFVVFLVVLGSILGVLAAVNVF